MNLGCNERGLKYQLATYAWEKANYHEHRIEKVGRVLGFANINVSQRRDRNLQDVKDYVERMAGICVKETYNFLFCPLSFPCFANFMYIQREFRR
jgi:hypothetical protein